jgi:hypothetical protein
MARIAPVLAAAPAYRFRVVAPNAASPTAGAAGEGSDLELDVEPARNDGGAPSIEIARARGVRKSLTRYGIAPRRLDVAGAKSAPPPPKDLADGGADMTYEVAIMLVPRAAAALTLRAPSADAGAASLASSASGDAGVADAGHHDAGRNGAGGIR